MKAPFPVLGLLLCAACATGEAVSQSAPGKLSLTSTEWTLVAFESPKDTIGVIRPGAGETYTIRLNPDGSAAFQLFCNRGTGQWHSPDAEHDMGTLAITPGAMTMAACPPSSLERLGADLPRIASFVIRGGKLNLNLAMGGGNYVWAPTR